MKLVSVHLPKTAGSSFRTSLESIFKQRFQKDYQGSGIALSAFERNKKTLTESLHIAEQGVKHYDCVHGHFMPAKYLLLNDIVPLTFITWMREPIARLISHYNYWHQAYNPDTSAPHHRQVIEENWSLEKFCLSEPFRNIYTKYLWGFPLENFAFIGITECYAKDFRYFTEKYLNTSLPIQWENMSKKPDAASTTFDPEVLKAIKDFHAEDIALYQRALSIRNRLRR